MRAAVLAAVRAPILRFPVKPQQRKVKNVTRPELLRTTQRRNRAVMVVLIMQLQRNILVKNRH